MKSREFRLSDFCKRRLQDGSALEHLIATGESVQSLTGYSDATMAKLYEVSRRLLSEKRYPDAADAFLFLASLNPRNSTYWIAFGMASQMLGQFETAVDAYELAVTDGIENPIPYLYLGKCFFALHERENALEAFSLAIEYADDHPEHNELKQIATTARDLLLRERKVA